MSSVVAYVTIMHQRTTNLFKIPPSRPKYEFHCLELHTERRHRHMFSFITWSVHVTTTLFRSTPQCSSCCSWRSAVRSQNNQSMFARVCNCHASARVEQNCMHCTNATFLNHASGSLFFSAINNFHLFLFSLPPTTTSTESHSWKQLF